MKLNCIQWWDFSSGDLGSVGNSFIAIIPRSTADLTILSIIVLNFSSKSLPNVSNRFFNFTFAAVNVCNYFTF